VLSISASNTASWSHESNSHPSQRRSHLSRSSPIEKSLNNPKPEKKRKFDEILSRLGIQHSPHYTNPNYKKLASFSSESLMSDSQGDSADDSDSEESLDEDLFVFFSKRRKATTSSPTTSCDNHHDLLSRYLTAPLPFKTSNIAEEMSLSEESRKIRQFKEAAVQLLSLYRNQYVRLSTILNVKHAKYLLKHQKATSQTPSDNQNLSEVQRKRFKILKKYHYNGYFNREIAALQGVQQQQIQKVDSLPPFQTSQ